MSLFLQIQAVFNFVINNLQHANKFMSVSSNNGLYLVDNLYIFDRYSEVLILKFS